MKTKRRNLQPWLDYFRLLQSYTDAGVLDVKAEKHEAYVTRSALCSLVPEGLDGGTADGRVIASGIPGVLRRIRTYAAWLSREPIGYTQRPFALHVVGEDAPHDLIYTLVVTSRRRWWKLWMWHDSIEVIDYGGGKGKGA